MTADHTLPGPPPAGVRSEMVRQSNLNTVLRLLHLGGAASRSEVVARTGLTRSAVGALISDLVDMGYVTESRAPSDGSPGRPSPVAHTNEHDHITIAIEILVDSIAVALVGLGGRILRAARTDRSRGRVSAEQTVKDVADLIADIVEPADPTDTDRPAPHVYGIGVTVAGVVRRADNTVIVAPNLDWHRVPLGSMLSDALGLDVPIQIANDGDLGVLAESRRGIAAGHTDIIFVSGEVGVGGGVISGGIPVRGSAGYGGEIGHMAINPDGRPCKCGGIGCWETEVGEEALLRRADRPPAGGRAEVAALLAAAGRGDQASLAALDEHGRWLGIGLSSLVNIFDPTMIVLGGFLGEVHPYVADRVRHEMTHRSMSAVRSAVDVAPSGLKIDGPLLGAAELAWDPVLSDPAAATTWRTQLVPR